MIQPTLAKPKSKAHLDAVGQDHLLQKVQAPRSNARCAGKDSQVMAGANHYYTDHGDVVSQGDMCDALVHACSDEGQPVRPGKGMLLLNCNTTSKALEPVQHGSVHLCDEDYAAIAEGTAANGQVNGWEVTRGL